MPWILGNKNVNDGSEKGKGKKKEKKKKESILYYLGMYEDFTIYKSTKKKEKKKDGNGKQSFLFCF